jgi:beta-glucosidase
VAGFVKGLQGDHPRYYRVTAGCKHFDVHGGPENLPVGRFSFDAKVRFFIHYLGLVLST